MSEIHADIWGVLRQQADVEYPWKSDIIPITSWDCVDKDVGWDANIQRYERSRMLNYMSRMSILAACHGRQGWRSVGCNVSGCLDAGDIIDVTAVGALWEQNLKSLVDDIVITPCLLGESHIYGI